MILLAAFVPFSADCGVEPSRLTGSGGSAELFSEVWIFSASCAAKDCLFGFEGLETPLDYDTLRSVQQSY